MLWWWLPSVQLPDNIFFFTEAIAQKERAGHADTHTDIRMTESNFEQQSRGLAAINYFALLGLFGWACFLPPKSFWAGHKYAWGEKQPTFVLESVMVSWCHGVMVLPPPRAPFLGCVRVRVCACAPSPSPAVRPDEDRTGLGLECGEPHAYRRGLGLIKSSA